MLCVLGRRKIYKVVDLDLFIFVLKSLASKSQDKIQLY